MILFKNGLVIDGTSCSPYRADVLVDGEEIKTIAQNIDVSLLSDNSIEIYDIKERIICPGFMDIHSHTELESLRNPSLGKKVQQGITFDVSGNCGLSVYPRNEQDEPVFADILGHYEHKWDWTDFRSFVKEREPGINMAFLQGHANLRMTALKGNPNRPATDAEISKMCDLLDASLSQGCLGFSTGLYYAPCLFAERKEIVALLKVVKKHDALFCVHHRCEGDEVLPSLDEILSYVKETGVRVQISHLKAIGKDNQDKVPQMLAKIHEMKDLGYDIAFDQYPYEYGSTSLFSLLPPSLLKLESDKLSETLLKACKDKALWNEIVGQMKNPDGWDSVTKLCGFENITIVVLESSACYNGMTIKDAASKMGVDEYTALFTLLGNEKSLALMADVTQSRENLEKIFKDDLMCFGTDSLYVGSFSHPRSANGAVHLIQTMCLSSKVVPLEEAIAKMTGKVATRLGLRDRGFVKEGFKADLVVFDPRTLCDKSSLTNPFERCNGLEHVLVNGSFAMKNGSLLGSRCGKIIRF